MGKIKSTTIKKLIAIIISLLLGLIGGASVDIAIRPTETKTELKITAEYAIELSEEQIPALIENSDGVIEAVSAPTVEEIDGDQAMAPEDKLPDLGQGATFDISSPQAFKDATIGKCTDLDGYYGSQCVDLFGAFQKSYTNRWLDVCGTGSAYGLWDCRDKNAGDDYELITDINALKAGDWVVFGGGQYGHVGMAMGPYNAGYVALLGQNQGGSSCAGGGSSANIINMSTKTFLGAFRPKIYIKEEPTEPVQEPIPISGCSDWNVVKGDTMSGIMLTCEGTVVYGQAMERYADTWNSTYLEGKSVYYGWTHGSGYGLYAGDYLLHNLEGEN